MKAIQLIIAAGIVAGTAFAQTTDFIEPRNLLKSVQPEITTFKVKDVTYVMYDSYTKQTFTRDVQVDAYDANMKFAGTSLVNKTITEGEPTSFEGVFALSDKLVIFKSEWDKKTGNAISVYPINANAARQNEGTKLCSFTAEKMMNSGSFNVNVSPDGSKIVVQCELPTVKDSLEHTLVYVYDNNFKQLWMKDYRFPNASGAAEKYRYNDVFVNNAGVVFDMKRTPVKKELDYFTVFTFLNNGAKVEERKMDLGEGGHISTYKSGFTTTGDLILSGYCYPDKKVGVNVDSPDNAFLVKVTADGGMPVSKRTPIKAAASLKAKYVLVLPDNSAILIGENEYVTETGRVGANAPTTSNVIYDYDYNNTNILIIKMNADGEKKWEHTIERDMKSRNDGGRSLGISALMMGDNLVITYQDFIYRHDGEAHMVAAGKDFWPVDVIRKINADGINAGEEYLKDKRLAGRDAEYVLLPASGVKVNETTLFFIAARGFELVPAKITL